MNWVYRCVTFRDPFVQVTSESYEVGIALKRRSEQR